MGSALGGCWENRFYNHHGVQTLGMKYRTDDELAEWKQRDPIELFEDRLAAAGVLDAGGAQAVHDAAQAAIEAAIAFAEESPLPDLDNLLVDVYTGANLTAAAYSGASS